MSETGPTPFELQIFNMIEDILKRMKWIELAMIKTSGLDNPNAPKVENQSQVDEKRARPESLAEHLESKRVVFESGLERSNLENDQPIVPKVNGVPVVSFMDSMF